MSTNVLIKLADYFDTNIDLLLCKTNYDIPISYIKLPIISDYQFKILIKTSKLTSIDIAKAE